ncbi:MAG: internal scaffolding protein [Microvirus sp.]|nr:MAG: internal scaffolding protein [Microvirus sp.]
MSKSLSVFDAPFVRSPYNYDRKVASDESGLLCQDVSLTSQSFAQESDINWIVENFTRRPDLLTGGAAQPHFGDFTGLPSDYQSALNQIRAADAAFMTLDHKVRSRFANDPGKLLAFLSDPSNRAEAVTLGLVKAGEAAPDSGAKPAVEGTGGA